MNLETNLPSGLWDSVRANLEKRSFAEAVLDAFYFLSDLLREKSGAVGDGATLVGQALGGANPKIRINKLESESEKSIQRGLEMTLRGLYQAIRNPRSHEKVKDSEDDAKILILFIGYLTRQIDQAKSQFSPSEFLKKVFDSNFVPNERYARLLVNEIPAGRRLDVFLDVFRVMETGLSENLTHFFSALLEQLSTEEIRTVYDVVSDTLRRTDDDRTIRQVIVCIGPRHWPQYSEVARLRIENRLIKSVREGRFDESQNRCRSGALGAWSSTLFPHFSLKREMLEAISDKLRSSSDEELGYALRFFFVHLNQLAESMPRDISKTLVMKLQSGDERIHKAVVNHCPWDRSTFSPELAKAISGFQPGFPPEEELPF